MRKPLDEIQAELQTEWWALKSLKRRELDRRNEKMWSRVLADILLLGGI